MLLSKVLFLSLCTQASGEEYFKFPEGTVWTYSRTEVGKAKVVTRKIAKVEGDKVTIEESITEAKNQNPPTSNTMLLLIEGGFVKQATLQDGKPAQTANIYKLSSKKGDHWRLAPGDNDEKTEVTHMGVEEVETPAGKFKDVLHLRMTLNLGTIDTYLAPKVGIVKETLTFPPDAPDVQLLLKFVPGGK